MQTDLTYDPLGRLYSVVSGATTTQFLYDGDRLVAEYNGASALQRRYAHGPGVDEPVVWYEGANFVTSPDRRWLHADERGSVIAVSDASGSGTEYTYGPYGEPAAWSGSRFRYTGQIALPEVELYHYKARVYDPVLGRFLQTDPVGYKDDLNLLAYVGNDPANKVDPTGLICQTTQESGASCTIDKFRDRQGNEITRDQATANRRDARKIARLEAKMTSEYQRAQRLAARNGSVTLRGNSRRQISDMTVSGQEIVGAMESVVTTAAAGLSTINANSNATTTNVLYSDGIVRTEGITFWGNGRSGADRTFGHEILHTIYSTRIRPPLSGWDALSDPALHQDSFDNAASGIR